MFTDIMVVLKELLLSPALGVELQGVEADFESESVTVSGVDRAGVTYPLSLYYPLDTSNYQQIDLSEPPDPKRIAGPYPRAYIYHLGSEYPKSMNKTPEIVNGIHKIGISIFLGDTTVSDAESKAGRLAQATKQLIERNQYLYGQLSRSGGTSTLAEVPTLIPGVKLPSNVFPYHLIASVQTTELRLP